MADTEGLTHIHLIVRDLDRVILPGITHWQHPQFFGYFPSNGALASVLGDFLSTGLGVIGLSWQSSHLMSQGKASPPAVPANSCRRSCHKRRKVNPWAGPARMRLVCKA